MTAQQLAERTKELGYPVTRVAISKIESNSRAGKVDVAELLVLGAALGVPPVTLIFGGPLGRHGGVAARPHSSVRVSAGLVYGPDADPDLLRWPTGKIGKTVVRYQLTVDAGLNPETGKRQPGVAATISPPAKALWPAMRSPRSATQRPKACFVARSAVTIERVCADYVAGRHNLRATSLSKLAYDLAPLRERHGDLPVQRLAKAGGSIRCVTNHQPSSATDRQGRGRPA